MNMCYSTYISFSKLGFKALHVQSGPCSHLVNHSVKAVGGKKTHRCLNSASVMFALFKYDLAFLKRLNYLTYGVLCDTNHRCKCTEQHQKFIVAVDHNLNKLTFS